MKFITRFTNDDAEEDLSTLIKDVPKKELIEFGLLLSSSWQQDLPFQESKRRIL